MIVPERILLFHTAFIGDIILMLPLVQETRRRFPKAQISVLAIPAAAEALKNHPAIDDVMMYDKRGADRGLSGLIGIVRKLRERKFDLAIVPHRSIRSALVIRLAGIPRRIGFSTSAGRFLFSDVVHYDPDSHETTRDRALLTPLDAAPASSELPCLYPSREDILTVDNLIAEWSSQKKVDVTQCVAIAPGSVWNTKRWPAESFVALTGLMVKKGFSVVLIGGESDRLLCQEIEQQLGKAPILNAAGLLTILQSAELIRRCKVIVTNDSAPMHMAVAMRTPVVALFGATVPEFGFAPLGEHDVVMETLGLPCRPCSIHGGDVCPIRTFVCMKQITPDSVFKAVEAVLQTSNTHGTQTTSRSVKS